MRKLREWKARVYIAGPLHTSGIELENVRRAATVWYSLAEAGFAAYVPHLNVFMQFMRSNTNREFWLQHDFEWLSTCDLVVRLPGRSDGAEDEARVASQLGIPVWDITDEHHISTIGTLLTRELETGRLHLRNSTRASPEAQAFTFQALQDQVTVWSNENFGNQPSYRPLLGLVEEVGELSHAHLKAEQGIRDTIEKLFAKKENAIGDIFVYGADYCAREGINLAQAIWKTWQEVSKRDWKKNPMDADKVAEQQG